MKNLLTELLNLRKRLLPKQHEQSDAFVPSPQVWIDMLDFVRSNRITEKQLSELVSALSLKEEVYSSDIRKRHPQLTANELLICNYVVEGKKSGEIARLLHVGVSTVTANRCRIRRKLKLPKGRSLKVYLDSISRLKRK